MDFSVEALRPHLEAFAYLAEMIYAQGMFLRHFEKRERGALRSGRLLLAVMFVLAAATGIPSGSSLVRFLWYFVFMAWQVLGASLCFQGGLAAVGSACMAGFATQHIANKVTILLRLIPPVGAAAESGPVMAIVLEVPVFLAVYVLVNAAFARQIRYWSDDPHLNLLSAAIIFLCIGVNRLVVDNAGESVQYEVAVCLYAIIGCVFALIIQVYISRWEEERSQALIMRRLLADSEKRYEQWKANVEQVNVFAHDVRHMLARMESLAENRQVEPPDLRAVREAVERFSPAVRTGNDVLDVLLRSMSDLCGQDGMTLNCVAYTDYLKYFDGMSLYFLFANAIDNAMESVAQVEEADKRLIEVAIRRFGSSVVIHIWNYYTGELDFVNGLPVTRYDRKIHGFGMKSIELIVERFGGVLNVRAEDGIFNLDILLPLKEADGEARGAG